MSDICMGAVKMSGAVVDGNMSVGGGIRVGGTKVGGAIRMGEGGSAPTEARWGEITGNIQSQTDLMDSLAAKQDIVSGEDGQFLSLVDGVWTAVDLPTYEGGVE